jgi:hypothetical protein
VASVLVVVVVVVGPADKDVPGRLLALVAGSCSKEKDPMLMTEVLTIQSAKIGLFKYLSRREYISME